MDELPYLGHSQKPCQWDPRLAGQRIRISITDHSEVQNVHTLRVCRDCTGTGSALGNNHRRLAQVYDPTSMQGNLGGYTV
jgi:hypothetical protein